MTEFAIKVLKMKPNTKLVCSFSDIAQETPEMRFYMKTACQLGLMGLKSDGKTPDTIFTPRATITRAQFGTILSRLIYGDVYNIYP
ncbi:MAG: S-layer homology domain-containing protein [bacterium]